LILCENQTGFWKGYSTIDNLFIVHSFFEILKKKKKKCIIGEMDCGISCGWTIWMVICIMLF
jgi:hypothetical protein